MKDILTIKQIVVEYLKASNFDGLRHPDFECSCITSYLMPCSDFEGLNPCDVCVAGYRIECECWTHPKDCDCGIDHDHHGFHIVDRK